MGVWRHPWGPLEQWQRLELWEPPRLFLVSMARGGLLVDGPLTGSYAPQGFELIVWCIPPPSTNVGVLNLSINLWQSTHFKELIFEDEARRLLPVSRSCAWSKRARHHYSILCGCLQVPLTISVFPCEVICILWPDLQYKTRELMLPDCGSLVCDE